MHEKVVMKTSIFFRLVCYTLFLSLASTLSPSKPSKKVDTTTVRRKDHVQYFKHLNYTSHGTCCTVFRAYNVSSPQTVWSGPWLLKNYAPPSFLPACCWPWPARKRHRQKRSRKMARPLSDAIKTKRRVQLVIQGSVIPYPWLVRSIEG